jgi:Leucine Rich repeat
MNNTSLTSLNLRWNDIEGAEGGQQVGVLLQRCPNLKVLDLSDIYLGPLGARAMNSGLVAASNLESLDLDGCGIGNNGLMELVSTSLTSLYLCRNDIQGLEDGEHVVALAARCTNLVRLDVDYVILNKAVWPCSWTQNNTSVQRREPLLVRHSLSCFDSWRNEHMVMNMASVLFWSFFKMMVMITFAMPITMPILEWMIEYKYSYFNYYHRHFAPKTGKVPIIVTMSNILMTMRMTTMTKNQTTGK